MRAKRYEIGDIVDHTIAVNVMRILQPHLMIVVISFLFKMHPTPLRRHPSSHTPFKWHFYYDPNKIITLNLQSFVATKANPSQ